MQKMTMEWALLLSAVVALAACEPVGPEVETSDATADVTKADAVIDAGADTGTKPDVAVADTAADVSPADADGADSSDVAADATPSADTGPDAAPDAADVADAVADVASDVDVAADGSDVSDTSDGFVVLPTSPTNIDVVGLSWSCTDAVWQAPTCAPGMTMAPALLPGYHVDLPNAITYADVPPSSGTHRPMWGVWGEYEFLPEQRWLHNLEHGGIAFLYHPCAPPALIEALRAVALAKPADATGPFRWVMTPYPGLPSAIALVSWGHVYEASCVEPAELQTFIADHYRKAPEDEPYPGLYKELWLGNWP